MPRVPPDPRFLHDIYIDESSQTKHRFLALGGLTLQTRDVGAFEDAIHGARLPELPHGELAWTKVSPGKLAAYERVVDAVLRPAWPTPRAEFHCLVVDTSRLRHSVFNEGSREVGFNKEIYQLCQKFGRLNRAGIFHVYLDQRETRSSTQELRNILNHGIRKKQPGRDWPFRRVHFRDSASCACLQVVDILLGAVAFHLNGHRHRPEASAAKCSLSDRVLSLANVRDVMRGTTASGRFTVWHRQLK
jgi:hypothetical protein